MRDRQRLDAAISSYTALERDLSDNIELIGMGEAENDQDIVTEAEKALLILHKRVQRLEGHAVTPAAFWKPSNREPRRQMSIRPLALRAEAAPIFSPMKMTGRSVQVSGRRKILLAPALVTTPLLLLGAWTLSVLSAPQIF